MKHFFLKTAYLLGQESKCVSRQVGALIVHDRRIISTGINGTPKGFENCCDHFPNYNFLTDREAHHNWSKKYEVHAEMNAINFAAKHGIAIEEAELYCILEPCSECLKNIIAAGIKKIYFVNQYDKNERDNELWSKIEHEQVTDPELLQWIRDQDEYLTWCKHKENDL